MKDSASVCHALAGVDMTKRIGAVNEVRSISRTFSRIRACGTHPHVDLKCLMFASGALHQSPCSNSSTLRSSNSALRLCGRCFREVPYCTVQWTESLAQYAGRKGSPTKTMSTKELLFVWRISKQSIEYYCTCELIGCRSARVYIQLVRSYIVRICPHRTGLMYDR